MSHVLCFQLTAYFDKTLSRVAQVTEVESVIADLQVGGASTNVEVESVIADLQVGGAGKVGGVNVKTFTLQIHYSI